MTSTNKKPFQILAILLLFLFGGILESCIGTCGKGGFDESFRVTSLRANPIDANRSPVSRFDEQIRFSIETSKEYFSAISSPGFFSKAYACSPAEPINREPFTYFRLASNRSFMLNLDTIAAGINLLEDPRTSPDIIFPKLNSEYDDLIIVNWDSAQVDFPSGEHTFYFEWKGADSEFLDSVKIEVGL